VGVPKDHPYFEKDYTEVDVEVHGGLTYSKHCNGARICHKVEPNEDDNVWWFGFDCGHPGDRMPAVTGEHYRSLGLEALGGETYRTIGYVKSEIRKLAKQIWSHTGNPTE